MCVARLVCRMRRLGQLCDQQLPVPCASYLHLHSHSFDKASSRGALLRYLNDVSMIAHRLHRGYGHKKTDSRPGSSNFSTRVHDTYPLYVPLLPQPSPEACLPPFHITTTTPGAQRVRINHPTHGSKRYDGSSLASGFDAARGGFLDLSRNTNSNVVVLWINNRPQSHAP
jgi:hypothetical protein